MRPLLGAGIGALVAAGILLAIQSFRSEPPERSRGVNGLPPDTGILLIWFGVAVVVGLVTGVASRWPALGLGVAALVLVGRLWQMASRERRIYYQTTEAISVWVDMIKDTLVGGGGLSQSIESTASLAPEVIRPEVVRLAAAQRTLPQAEALRQFGAAMAHPTADLVVLALMVASENQARDLPRLLARTAEQARSRNTAVLQIETERSQLYTEARATVISIGLLGVVITLIAKDFLEPYSTFAGQIVLGVVMAIVVASAALLVQAGRPQPERRLLAPELSAQIVADGSGAGAGTVR
ncbi:MAG: hypothetical protein R2761_03020 [Acidimicrobiales bacterium]